MNESTSTPRSLRRARALVGCAIALVSVLQGCAHTTGRRAEEPVRAVSVVRDAADRTVWHPIVLPASSLSSGSSNVGGGWPQRAAVEPNGAINLVEGGYRLQLDDEGVHWASDTTLRPIRSYTQSRDHWLFATEDGALFEAESFLGPLTRRGDTNGFALRNGFESNGVLASLDQNHTLWLGREGENLQRAQPPLDHGLIDIGFVDAAFGAAVIVPGRLLRTTDGGAHWNDVNTARESVRIVYPAGDGFVLDTTHGLMFLGSTGDARPYNGPVPSLDHSIDGETLLRLRDTFREQHPLALAHAMSAFPTLSDGRVVLPVGQQILVMGAHVAPSVFPRPAGRCSLLPWGERLIASCTDQHRTTISLLEHEGFVSIGEFDREFNLIAGRDGRSLVFAGPCERAERMDTAMLRSVCWYNGEIWQSVELRGIGQPVGIWNHTLVHSVIDDPELPRALMYFATDLTQSDPTLSTRVFAIRPDGPSDQPFEVRVSVLADGTVVASGRSPITSDLMLSKGNVQHLPLSFVRMPSGTDVVAFADERHGLAVNDALTHVWATNDGAAWSEIALPLQGSASLAQQVVLPNDATAVTCSTVACSVAHRLVWTASERAGDGVHAALPLASTVTVEPTQISPPSRPDPSRSGFSSGHLLCAIEGAARPDFMPRSPSFVPLASGSLVLPAIERAFGADGWIELHRQGTPGIRGAGQFRVQWGARDERGFFQVTHAPTSITLGPVAVSSVTAGVNEVRFTPRLLSRHLALLERCVSVGTTPHCDLVSIPANGPARVAGEYDLWLASLAGFQGPGTAVAMQSGIATPDGGFVARLSTWIESRTQYDLVVQLNAAGVVVDRRGFSWGTQPTVRMLALKDRVPYMAAATTEAPNKITFYPIPSGAPQVADMELPSHVLRPCAARTPLRDVLVAEDDAYGTQVYVHGVVLSSGSSLVRTRIALQGNEQCVHSLSVWPNNMGLSFSADFSPRMGGVPSLTTSTDGWAGWVLSPEHAPHVMACYQTR